MFVHKPTFSTLDLTEDRITETIITCRLKKLFKPSIYRLYKASLRNTKRLGHKIVIYVNNITSIIEKNIIIRPKL